MINQIVIVGRINSMTSYGFTIKVMTPDSGKDAREIVLPVHITDKMQDNVKNYLEDGCLVGVKGHFDISGKTKKPIMIGDKITFLSSKGGDD